ncbi:hypothetical protein GCM10007981_06450 [Thermocladium modestius]|uniref:Uncharacterized protein n=1 Tax=Thermocladium modestius TaxID=62609 RepID=A0A830GVK3_9CREN|nr:hypothetical protein [Thermocladium modestius]GGP20030.1 hypothetical protein GCM10007981_06450 [Thermocladium modestius]
MNMKTIIALIGAALIVIGVAAYFLYASPIDRLTSGTFTVVYNGNVYVPNLGISKSFEAIYGQNTIKRGFILMGNYFGAAWIYNKSLIICPWTDHVPLGKCLEFNGTEGKAAFYENLQGLYCYKYEETGNRTLPRLPLPFAASRAYNLTVISCLNGNGIPIDVNITLYVATAENGLLGKLLIPAQVNVYMHAISANDSFNEALYDEMMEK